MPIYEYNCLQCGHVFEEIRNTAERDKDLICPQCHSMLVERVLAPFSLGSSNACNLPSAGHG